MTITATAPAASLQVYSCRHLTCQHGANEGDDLSFAAELSLNDTYILSDHAVMGALQIVTSARGGLRIADKSALGTVGATLHLDCCATFVSDGGETLDLIILVEVDGNSAATGVYALPLGSLQGATAYTLVAIDRLDEARHFAGLACLSFAVLTPPAANTQAPIRSLAAR